MTSNENAQQQVKANPTTGPVLGTWVNVNATPSRWQKVVVGEHDVVIFGKKIQIFYFEAWQADPALHLAPISVNLFGEGYAGAQSSTAFTATWPEKGGPNANIHFADASAVGHIEADKLVMDTFVTFLAGDTRSNYRIEERFRRG